MKQNVGYEIDFVEGKIIVSKKFLREAGTINTAAYSELVQIRKDYPDFTIAPRQIAKRENKMTYGKLTYKAMAEFIEAQEEEQSAAVLKEFERMQQLSKAHNGQYAFVKSWFLKRYQDVFGQDDEATEAAS